MANAKSYAQALIDVVTSKRGDVGQASPAVSALISAGKSVVPGVKENKTADTSGINAIWSPEEKKESEESEKLETAKSTYLAEAMDAISGAAPDTSQPEMLFPSETEQPKADPVMKVAVGHAEQAASNVGNAVVTLADAASKSLSLDEAINANTPANLTFAKMYNNLDKLTAKGQEEVNSVRGELGTGGKLAVDIGGAAMDLVGDAAANLVVPGAGMAAMATRVFGASAQEARQSGATTQQQVLYGGVKAGIEYATEKMFDGLAGVYGKGTADDVVEKVVAKLAKTDTGRTALRTGFNALGEASEEVVSDVLDPVAKGIYDKFATLKDKYSSEEAWKEALADELYDGLIGAVMSAGGSAVNIVSGSDALKNAALRNSNTETTTPATVEAEKPSEVTTVEAAPAEQPKTASEMLSELGQQTTPIAQETAPQTVKPQESESVDVAEEVPTPENHSAAVIDQVEKAPKAENEHIINRNVDEISSRKVNAFQFDNPEIRPNFLRAAEVLYEDLIHAKLGERTTRKGGTIQTVANEFAEFRDRWNLTTIKVIQVLEDIIHNNGQENYADAKKVELFLDYMLRNGYTPASNNSLPKVEVDEDYLEKLKNINGGEDIKSGIDKEIQAEIDAAMFDGEELSWEDARDLVLKHHEEEAKRDGSWRTKNQWGEERESFDTLHQRVSESLGINENVDNVNENVDTEEKETPKETPKDPHLNMETEKPETITLKSEQPKQQSGNQQGKSEEEPVPAEQKRSQTESHTMQSISSEIGAEQKPLYYTPISEKESLMNAAARVNASVSEEMGKLYDKEMWTGEDIDTALTIYGKLQADGLKTGDTSTAEQWSKIVQEHGTKSGQALQAFSKWTRTGAATAADVVNNLMEAAKDDNAPLTEEEAKEIAKQVYDLANKIDSATAQDHIGDVREAILKMNEMRNTGTFFEKNFGKILNKITDMDYLIEYALRQMQNIASDYTDRPSLAKKLKTWQVNAQLTRLGTFFRNIGGNLSFGAVDTMAQDAFGVALDHLVSNVTGAKEVGFDKGWFSSNARKASLEAFNRSVLEVAGDVNMMGEGSKYGNNSSRTYKMTGNKMEQFMSRWEQLLSYSLTVSDRVSRGQIEASVAEGLKGNGDAAELAKQLADYRLFQNKGTAAGLSQGARDTLNKIGTKEFGLGDLLNPYPGVPANLAVKALEYSPANIVKGGAELIDLLSKVNKGEEVEAGKQQQAIMDISRGMSGAPIIALFASMFKAGLLKNSDDEDDLDAQNQNSADGYSGVQINLSAAQRWLSGESVSEWQNGDNLMKISWMEPINAFMAIASLIASEDEDAGIGTLAKDYASGAIQSVLDMPVMTNISDLYDTYRYSTADTMGEKALETVGSFAGNSVTGMIPAPISQLASVTDDYKRDTSADTFYEKSWNKILNAIPGAKETLPIKTDNFGNPITNEENVLNRALNTFVLPGTITTLKQGEISAATQALYEATGDAGVYPDRNSKRYITNDGEKVNLTADERRENHATYGQAVNELYSTLMSEDYYDELTSEQQAEIAKDLKSFAKTYADEQTLKAKGIEYEEALPAVTDPVAYFTIKALGTEYNSRFDMDESTPNYDGIDYLLQTVYANAPDDVKDNLNDNSYYAHLDEMYAASQIGIDSKTWNIINQTKKVIDEDENLSSTRKAEKFKSYLAQTGLNSRQQKLMAEQFQFYSSFPASTDIYDKLVAAGVDNETAENFKAENDTDGSKDSWDTKDTINAIEKYAKNAKEAQKMWEALAPSATLKKNGDYLKYNSASKFN